MSGEKAEHAEAEKAARETVLDLARLLARLAAREDDAAERKSRQGLDAADTVDLTALPARGQPHSTG